MLQEKSLNVKPGLRDYWQIFLRRKWLIVLPVVAIVSIAIPGSFLLTPVYQASTTLISQEVERGSVLQGVANIPVPRGEEMNTVRYKIESRRYMKEVADKVGIADYLSSIGKESNIDNVVRYLRGIVTLRARSSKIIEISVMHPRPDMAKNIADTIANTYVDKTLKWRQDTTVASTSFINQELDVYRQRLREAEEALLAAQEKGVLDSSSNGIYGTLTSEFAKLRTDLVEVELDLQEAESELENSRRLLAEPGAESYSSAFYTDPEVAGLEAKLAGLQTQYAELSMRYTDQYPEARKLKGEIIRTQEELDQAKAKSSTRQQDIAARLQYWEDRVRTLKLKRTALNDKIGEYNRKLQRLPQRQMELARLGREKAAAENTYSMLLARLNESELLRSSELQNMGRVAEVLDPAIVPDRPVKPNKKKIAILAIAMGMMIGCGSAFVLEYFDRSFRSVDDVTGYLGIPVLATIPRLTTYESEVKARKRRRIKIACMASLSLLVLVLIADIVSAELFARNSFFLSIARSGLGLLRRL
jgi:succinoglycan biosynthesis transport protein ExoP